MKKVLLAMAIVLGAVSTQAANSNNREARNDAWTCSFGFTGRSAGLKFIVGFYSFNGKGVLQCVSDSNDVVTYPVKIKMRGAPISPAISLGVMGISARAADFRLVGHNPEDVFGTYGLAQGQVAVGGGLGIVTAVRHSNPGLAMNLALQLTHGLGVNLGFNKMQIELDQSQDESSLN